MQHILRPQEHRKGLVMFLVMLRNVCAGHSMISETQRTQSFHVTFRQAERAEMFARSLACLLVQHLSCKWELAIYEVEPSCWPDAGAEPLLRWRCG